MHRAGRSYAADQRHGCRLEPRIISNLIVDQTTQQSGGGGGGGSAGVDGVWGTADDVLNDGVSILRTVPVLDGLPGTADDVADFSFANVAPDAACTRRRSTLWFVFFGQFFDHGLDLVQKGGSGTVFIPLQPDDPLISGLMVRPALTTICRRSAVHGADLGHQSARPRRLPATTPDAGDRRGADDIHEHTNQTSPFVDQNQTYTSTPRTRCSCAPTSFNGDGDPVATGKLITNRNLVDGDIRQRRTT